MGDSPAARIHADEVRIEGNHHLPGYDPGHFKEAGVLFAGELMPPGNMSFGDHQAVAFAKGIDIQDA